MKFLRSIFVFVTMLLATLAVHASDITLDKSDFLSAKEIKRRDEIVVSANLSKTGKEKVLELNKSSVGQNIKIQIAGEIYDLKLRAPINDNSLQFGPFSDETAKKIVTEINSLSP
jgi:hypothetical protein